jgi:acyl-CoA thioesterase I
MLKGRGNRMSLKIAEALAAGMLFLFCGCSSGSPSNSSQPAAPPEAAGVGGKTEAPPAPADTRPVIAAFGDSLTAGLGVDPALNYPSRLQAKLQAEGYPYRVVNAGVSGDTSAQGLNRLEAVRALGAQIVIVALGANDGLRGIPVEETRRNLAEIIRTLKRDGVVVILAGIEIPPNYGAQFTAQFREMYRALAREYRVPFLPFLLEGVGGRADLNQEDGVHPTAQGYAIVAENVWKVLKPTLKRFPDGGRLSG